MMVVAMMMVAMAVVVPMLVVVVGMIVVVVMDPLARTRPARILAENQGFDGHRHGV